MTYFSELFFADDYLRRKSSRPNVRVISSLIDLCSRSAVHVQCSTVHACMYIYICSQPCNAIPLLELGLG